MTTFTETITAELQVLSQEEKRRILRRGGAECESGSTETQRGKSRRSARSDEFSVARGTSLRAAHNGRAMQTCR